MSKCKFKNLYLVSVQDNPTQKFTMAVSTGTICFCATQGANKTTDNIAIASILLRWYKSFHKYFFIELAGFIFRHIADKYHVEKIFEFKK